MSLILILFFVSLAGISFMIGRKLILLKRGQIIAGENFFVEIPDLQEIKYIAVQGTKKYGYILLVETLRFSIRSSYFLKKKGGEIAEKIKNKFSRSQSFAGGEPEKREVSKFLKMISEYKEKIGKIKNKIKEEEGIE